MKKKMISLREVNYTVEIWLCSSGYYWKAFAPYGTEQLIHTETESGYDRGELVFSSDQGVGGGFKTEKKCKEDWEMFASLNGLKKWKWKKE